MLHLTENFVVKSRGSSDPAGECKSKDVRSLMLDERLSIEFGVLLNQQILITIGNGYYCILEDAQCIDILVMIYCDIFFGWEYMNDSEAYCELRLDIQTPHKEPEYVSWYCVVCV